MSVGSSEISEAFVCVLLLVVLTALDFKLVVVMIDVDPVVIVKMLPDIMPSPLLSACEG